MRPLLLAESGEGRSRRPQHRGEQDEEDVEPVDAEAVVDAEAGDPVDVDRVLQAGGAGIEATAGELLGMVVVVLADAEDVARRPRNRRLQGDPGQRDRVPERQAGITGNSPLDEGEGAEARCVGPTGVEMEALTAVSVACLTIYDMAKAIDRGMSIERLRLIEKRGGKSGDWRAAEEPKDKRR